MFLSDDFIRLKELFFAQNSMASEYCFLGHLVWQRKYDFELLNFDSSEQSIVIYVKKNLAYRFPIVKNSEEIKNVILKIIQHDELNKNSSLSFERITLEQKQFLEENFTGLFSFEEQRGDFDYIYSIDSLINLSGRKYSKKRNHINGFLSKYSNWKIEEISEKNIEEVLSFSEQWYESKLSDDLGFIKENLRLERISVNEFLPKIAEYEADGIVLYVDDKVCGYTAGQRIGINTYDTVFEKATEEITGSYNLLNREFAKYLKEKYPELKFINRESDIDHPGLRKSKLSYNPELLLQKYKATYLANKLS